MAVALLLLAFAAGLVVGESDRLLPPVFAIPRNTTASLDVDLFFSLFFVFLNKDLKETSSDYTIFAPAGLTTREAARWLEEEKLTEQLLLNHIVVGTHLRPELVASSGGPWTTLGGEQVSVAIDDQGEFRVNGVRVLAWTTEGPALIVVLEDYLFKEKGAEKDEDQKSSQEVERVKEEQEQTTKGSIREVTEDKGEFPQAKPRKANQRNCTKVGPCIYLSKSLHLLSRWATPTADCQSSVMSLFARRPSLRPLDVGWTVGLAFLTKLLQ